MKLLFTAFLLAACLGTYSQPLFWKARVNTGEYGMLNVNFTLQPNGAYLSGSSAPGAHKRIIGGLKASLAKGMFRKDGSLIELDSIVFRGNSFSGFMILNGLKYILRGTKEGKSIVADLTGRSERDIFGRFEATEVTALDKPQNYPQVWSDIKRLTEELIYNRSVLQDHEWKRFVKAMNGFSAIAKDDAEFAYGLYFHAMRLPFTHYSLQGSKDSAKHFLIPAFNKTKANIRPSLQRVNDQTFLLDVPKFNFRVADIDSLMQVIVNSDVRQLIIDLRKNTGGDMEGAMRIGQYLSDKTFYGGVMLSQQYWNTHSAPPRPEDYSKFKLMDNANYEWFKQQVRNGVDGLCLKTEPMDKTFQGRVFILTSSSTASASEPFVYTLQKENRATVIGSKTAGAVISMEYVPVSNFELTIPMLDYYTYDGKRLDKIGVEPNIACKPSDALTVALTQTK